MVFYEPKNVDEYFADVPSIGENSKRAFVEMGFMPDVRYRVIQAEPVDKKQERSQCIVVNVNGHPHSVNSAFFRKAEEQ